MDFPFSIYVWQAPRKPTDKPRWVEELRADKDGDVTVQSCSAICNQGNAVTNVGQPAARDRGSGVTRTAAGWKCDAKEVIHSVARRINVANDLLLHLWPWAR